MTDTKPRTIIAWSEVLGAFPCRVIGSNRTHYLVQILEGIGATGVTMNLPKESVFELQEGWAVQDGQIVPAEGGEPVGLESPAVLQFEPETVPTDTGGTR
jgi:hypothetical protein